MKKILYLLPVMLMWACQSEQSSQKEAETTAAPAKPTVNEAVQQLFEEVNVVKMHLFATQEADPNAESYPYTGKPFGEDLLKFLPDGVEPNEAVGVYACYRTENNGFFILRVPGKMASSDLILCKWDDGAGKLKKVNDLARIQCDDTGCQQQDAWLIDLDDDRKLELITRSKSFDSKGGVTAESFDVLSQDNAGSFAKSSEQMASLALKENYVLHSSK
jgi:hypothetical protein